jgi:peptidoglycan/LPS O-acetylase OafA/YrhL
VQSPIARGHVAELDGVRGIAIVLVILHHYWPAGGPLLDAKPVINLGWIGVDLFFVISGFLITGILLDTRGEPGYYRNYLARRALRVFPLYYLLVITAFVVIPLVQPGSFWETELVQQSGSPLWYLLYAGNLREAITNTEPAYILAPLWSLSIEEQFYLTFPFLVALLSRRALVRVLVGMVVLAPVFRTVMLVLFPDHERIQYLATFSRMDVLALGSLLAIAVRSPGKVLPARRTTGVSFACLLAAGVIAYLAGGLDRETVFCRTIGYSLVGVTFLAGVTWTLQGRGSASTAWLRVRPLMHVGKLCYGIYLLQRPAEVVLVKGTSALGIPLDPTSPLTLLLELGFAYGVACASWYAFEKPILRLKRRFESARHPSADGVVAIRDARASATLKPGRVGVTRAREHVPEPVGERQAL